MSIARHYDFTNISAGFEVKSMIDRCIWLDSLQTPVCGPVKRSCFSRSVTMKFRSQSNIIITILLLIAVNSASAELRLPALIADHMVLQQQMAVPIWGWADPGEQVTVSASWSLSKPVSSAADIDGKWRVTLDTPKAGGPYRIEFKTDEDAMTVDNVMVGEVWVCSGQSNMQMGLVRSDPWTKGVFNYKSEIAAADYPNIRLFSVTRKFADTPQADCEGTWSPCSPETVPEFSAVAYFFARKVHQETGLPIGLIHTSWGGTPAEAWMSDSALRKLPDFVPVLEQLKLSDDAIEKLKQEHEQKMAKWSKDLDQAVAKVSPGAHRTDADDVAWPVMKLPTIWEAAGHGDLDGVVWFRKKIDIPADWQGKDLVLELGPIDDLDTTYVNGTKVGEVTTYYGGYLKPRIYTVPADAVTAGTNVIAVKVTDNTGDGGIYGKPDQLKIYPVGYTGEPLSLAGDWNYYIAVDLKEFAPMPISRAVVKNQNTPTLLYNAMLAPIIPYGIKGAIWYQGESNATRAHQYRQLFPALIINWRTDWAQGDFPFYFTQIAPFQYDIEGICPELQEAQLMTLALPNTGMAVTTDIGNIKDIHPRNKQMVGRRLARWALAKGYGHNDRVFSGPLYRSMQKEGAKVRLQFDHTGSGLMALGGDLKHFTMAGADKKFVEATAEIDNNTILVYSEQVTDPVAVRYAWSNTAVGNLYNFDGLPASPFRTDDWDGVTLKDSDSQEKK
jgi:sialate O-acetylesterase